MGFVKVLDMQVYSFHQICKSSGHYFFTYFSVPSPAFRNPLAPILNYLILPHSYWALFFFSFLSLFLSGLHVIFFVGALDTLTYCLLGWLRTKKTCLLFHGQKTLFTEGTKKPRDFRYNNLVTWIVYIVYVNGESLNNPAWWILTLTVRNITLQQ